MCSVKEEREELVVVKVLDVVGVGRFEVVCYLDVVYKGEVVIEDLENEGLYIIVCRRR